jgi:hypothetical protein
MNEYKDKTNNQILSDIKQMEFDYKSLKDKILKDYDELIAMEKSFAIAHKIINERLKRSE